MKLGFARICFALGLVASQLTLSAAEELYVSPSGQDSNPGTKEAPLQTPQEASKRVRELLAQERTPAPIDVIFSGGDYFLAAPWELTDKDSGTPESPVTYREAQGEEVRLIGGYKLSNWSPVEQDSVKSLPANTVGKVYRTNLKSQGIEAATEWTARGRKLPLAPSPAELFVKAERQPVAAWPNEGWAIAEVNNATRQVKVSELPSGLSLDNSAWVQGFWCSNDTDAILPIADANFQEKWFEVPNTVVCKRLQQEPRVRILNHLGLLDSPSEWYLDRDSSELYWWPNSGVTPNESETILSHLETPVSLYGTSFVTLEGFTIEAARVMGVEVAGGESVTLRDCTIRNVGNIGLHVYNGVAHQVVGCEVYNCGEGGIRIEGGERSSLTSSEHVIEGCHIYEFSQITHGYRAAIQVFGVNVRIANNSMHSGSHAAVIIHGNDHLLERNEIHSVCRETSDVGAIYLGQDPTFRGNVIRHNKVRDLGGFCRRDVIGIYLDDLASGTTVYGNILDNCVRGIAIGGGRDNVVENNLVINCLAGIQVDNRGTTWRSEWVRGEDSRVAKLCREVNHQAPPYSERYPELATMLEDRPAHAIGNQILRNIVNCPIGIDLHDGLNSESVVVDRNHVGKDAWFVNHRERDYQLDETSPVSGVEFETIPCHEIGPQTGSE